MARALADTARVLRQTYRCTLVMPMTVWRQAYFDELLDSVRRARPGIRCFRLTATETVLRARILGRPTTEDAHDWCLAHVSSGLQLMADSRLGQAVPTDDRTPGGVAAAILAEILGIAQQQRDAWHALNMMQIRTPNDVPREPRAGR